MLNGNRIGVRVMIRGKLRSLLGLWLVSELGFNFAVVLCNFPQFYPFRIVQMWNEYDIKIKDSS